MTHEPDIVTRDASQIEEELEAPADLEARPLDGIPVGTLDGAVDYDVQEALLLAQAATRGPDALHVVVQMGHVPRTTGKTGTAGEQDFSRAAAGHTAARLQQDGRTVRVIGADDAVPRSDVFVAIHCDGNANTNAHGASIGFRNADGARAGAAWKEAYQRVGWSRGFRPDNNTVGLSQYYGTGKAARAGTRFAFVLEAGFLTNPDDRALLANDGGHIRCAEAIRQTVSAVLGGVGSGVPPSEATIPFPGVILKKGSQGPDVCRVQARLRELGHSIDSFPHCPFGDQTAAAVKAFQQSQGLVDDSEIGSDTWRALFH